MKKILITLLFILTLQSCSLFNSPDNYPKVFYDKQKEVFNWKTYEGTNLCKEDLKYIYSDDFNQGIAQVSFVSNPSRIVLINNKCEKIHKGDFFSTAGFFTNGNKIVLVEGWIDEDSNTDDSKRAPYNFIDKNGNFILKDWVNDSTRKYQDGYIYLLDVIGENIDNYYTVINLIDKNGNLFFNNWPDDIYGIDISSDLDWVKELQKKDYGPNIMDISIKEDFYRKRTFNGYIYYMIDQNPTSKNDCGTTDFRGIDCKWYKVKEDNKSQIEYLGDNVHPEDILKKDEKLLKILRETKTERYIEKYLK